MSATPSWAKSPMEDFFNEIHELRDLCLNTETESWEKLALWAGIEKLEITWIPLLNLFNNLSTSCGGLNNRTIS
jgi:hypothetical protein